MEESKTGPRVIMIGGSAGSLQVIFRILADLGSDYSIPVVLVLHRLQQDGSRLTDVLRAKTNLLVQEIEDKDMLEEGHIYVCPADYHVLLEDDHSFSLDYSEKINYSRPSIDVAFTAASTVMGRKMVAVLLSGANADGAHGLRTVKEAGGITVVQDPADAEVSFMPEQALMLSNADVVLNSVEIGKYLRSLR